MKTINDLLNDKDNLSLCVGANNPLIAKIAENAGFDGIWVSSFESHAWNRLPDASILNVADYCDTISKISDRVNIPILIDADEGGPSAINTIRMAREYSKNGATGMCIEDNPTPKRCSFYGMKSQLEDKDRFAGKLRAAIDKHNTEDFSVIARTESLIQGHGFEVALDRAKLYTDSGCNGFLIHSKSDKPDDVLRCAEMYHREQIKTPLVCVPTTYNQVNTMQLRDAGFSMAIYANYSVRACVKVLEEMFEKMISSGTQSSGNDMAVPMTKIFELIAVDELKENQIKYGS